MKLNEEKLAKLITYTIQIEPDTVPYVGHCSAVDADTDRQAEDWIREQLEIGNGAAWCTVLVKAEALGIEGADSLGGCSYESEKQIEEDLIPEMKSNAYRDLVNRLTAAFNDLFQ